MKKLEKIIKTIILIVMMSICFSNFPKCLALTSTLYINLNTNKYGENIVVGQYSNNSEIKEVIIEEGITQIHDEAFSSCENLTDITIPRSIKFISDYAFWNCPQNITIHGYTGTISENYAKQKGYIFKDIEMQENLLPTYIDDEIILAENKINELNKKGAISFGFITDIHADNGTYSPIANIKAFTKLGNSELLKFGICAGDITTGQYDDLRTGKSLYNLQYYANMLNDTKMPMLFARGNHDCNTRDDANLAIPGEQYYESVLKKLDGEIVFDNNNIGGDYYYKDLEDEKIRVCVLNAFNGANYEFVFGNAQLEFVANKVLNLTDKENPQDWQVLFLTHTVDETFAHKEVPSDNEKLYKIINAFQDGKRDTISNISVNYTSQGKGTVIAIITGHHHLDSTTVKNNILIITVRSASILLDRVNRSEEHYNSDDISFDIFSIDKNSKMLYATKVGRGDSRCWSYDTNNLKENDLKETNCDTSSITNDYINFGTMLNHNNEVIAIVTSNVDLETKSNKSWKLSKDKKTYIKVLNDVTDEYTTTFTNINGYSKTCTFKINDIKDTTAPKLKLEYINNDDGTITAKVISNEILQTKGNTNWKLSKNRREYTYKFTKNTKDYTTAFKDMFGNETLLTLNAQIFEPNIEYIKNDDKTITVKMTSNTKFADTKPSWKLSNDGHTYTKTFTSNQNYTTPFTSIYGEVVDKQIIISAFNEELDMEISYIDNGDGTVTAKVESKNNKFADTKPSWTLSSDGYTYTKTFTSNQDYLTPFTNVFGKTVNQKILIKTFKEELNMEILYRNNEDGTITAIVVSRDNKFADTKPSWKLSNDGYTYTKTFTSNQDYLTPFTNVFGKTVNQKVLIDNFNEELDIEISYINNKNGTVTAKVKSKNNKFADTKPSWKLSNDGYTYTKTFTSNQNYTTPFTNIYGKSINANIKFNK